MNGQISGMAAESNRLVVVSAYNSQSGSYYCQSWSLTNPGADPHRVEYSEPVRVVGSASKNRTFKVFEHEAGSRVSAVDHKSTSDCSIEVPRILGQILVVSELSDGRIVVVTVLNMLGGQIAIYNPVIADEKPVLLGPIPTPTAAAVLSNDAVVIAVEEHVNKGVMHGLLLWEAPDPNCRPTLRTVNDSVITLAALKDQTLVIVVRGISRISSKVLLWDLSSSPPGDPFVAIRYLRCRADFVEVLGSGDVIFASGLGRLSVGALTVARPSRWMLHIFRVVLRASR